MFTARRPGVSYSRFSCLLQADGDSEHRQERDYRAFCERHNLTPGKEVFADRGRSGYHDAHRKKGRLGDLIAAAKDGRFEPGTVIVIEAWDRLGRLRPDRQTELVAELLRTGVSIGICRLDDIFSEEDFGTHKWTTLAIFIQLAYQESKQKAERVAASWEQRRQRAQKNGQLLTTQLPAWMEMVKGEVRLIPDRAAAVRRIYTLAAAGYGVTRVITALEKEKVPAFGKVAVRPGRTRSQFCGRWNVAYVALLLRDRRVIGELQPMKDDKPEGPPLVNYYPAAVSEDEFLLARAGQEERLTYDVLGRRNGSRQGKYVNVFKGLLKHARDGEGFALHRKSPDQQGLVLLNQKGRAGRSECYTYPYDVFEEAILGLLREVNPADVLPHSEEPNRVDVLRTRLANIRQDLAGLKAELKTGFSKGLAEVMRTTEADEERVANDLTDELARVSRPLERTWQDVPGLVDLIRTAADPDEVRLKLRPILRRVISEGWVLIVNRRSWRLVAVQLFLTGGAVRNYLIVRQTAGNQRPGGWWVKSFADAGVAGKLDLRKRQHVARLEKALLAMSLEPLAK